MKYLSYLLSPILLIVVALASVSIQGFLSGSPFDLLLSFLRRTPGVILSGYAVIFVVSLGLISKGFNEKTKEPKKHLVTFLVLAIVVSISPVIFHFTEQGKSAKLFVAVKKRDARLVAKHLSNGADPNFFISDINSLGLAIVTNQEDVVRLLMDHGADPHIKNQEGVGAKEIAEKSNNPRIKELIKVFKSNN